MGCPRGAGRRGREPSPSKTKGVTTSSRRREIVTLPQTPNWHGIRRIEAHNTLTAANSQRRAHPARLELEGRAEIPVPVQELVEFHAIELMDLAPDVVGKQHQMRCLRLVAIDISVQCRRQNRVLRPQGVVVGERRAVEGVLQLADSCGERDGLYT